MDPKFVRGYDMKMGKDTFVAIVTYANRFLNSTVRQMIGIGCRSQGTAAGCYFTYEFKPGDNVDFI